MKRTETVTETRTVWRCDLCDTPLDTEDDAPVRMPVAVMPVRGHGRMTFHLLGPRALDLCDHCTGRVSATLQSIADNYRGDVEA